MTETNTDEERTATGLKLLVLSDLHLEGGVRYDIPPGVQFDVAILAGDIHTPGTEAVHWARTSPVVKDRPVLLVAGNHELYGAPDAEGEMGKMIQAAVNSRVHVLNRMSVILQGVRFIGCTLWTDFQLPVDIDGRRQTNIERALHTANALMADYQVIRVRSPADAQTRTRQVSRLFRAEDALALHWVDRDWLLREMRTPFDGPTVVITHHAPAAGSLAAQYAGDRLSPAFVSDLPQEFFDVPSLWIHGHTHRSADYLARGCRIVSNPRGYRIRGVGFENASFDPGFVLEVGRASYECCSLGANMKDQNQRAMALILQGTRWLAADELSSARPGNEAPGVDLLDQWLAAGLIYTIEVDGMPRVPLYALNANGEPVAGLKPVLQTLTGLGGVQLAAFFESPSTWLDGRRPREVLPNNPAAVLYAAQNRMSGALHG